MTSDKFPLIFIPSKGLSGSWNKLFLLDFWCVSFYLFLFHWHMPATFEFQIKNKKRRSETSNYISRYSTFVQILALEYVLFSILVREKCLRISRLSKKDRTFHNTKRWGTEKKFRRDEKGRALCRTNPRTIKEKWNKVLGFKSLLRDVARCNDTIRWSCVFVLRRYGYCRFRLKAENCLVRKLFAIRCANRVSHSWGYRNSFVVIRSKRLHDTTRLEDYLCAEANTLTHTLQYKYEVWQDICARSLVFRMVFMRNGKMFRLFYLFWASVLCEHMINAFDSGHVFRLQYT